MHLGTFDLVKNMVHTKKDNCYTLVKKVYEVNNIYLPDFPYIDFLRKRDSVMGKTLSELFVEVEKPSFLTLCVFSTSDLFIDHMGVVLENKRKFIHLVEGRNILVTSLYDDYWRSKRRGFYDYNSS